MSSLSATICLSRLRLILRRRTRIPSSFECRLVRLLDRRARAASGGWSAYGDQCARGGQRFCSAQHERDACARQAAGLRSRRCDSAAGAVDAKIRKRRRRGRWSCACMLARIVAARSIPTTARPLPTSAGSFCGRGFTCGLTPEGLRIDMSAREGSYTPWWKEIRVVVYGWQPKEGNGAHRKWRRRRGGES